MQIPDSDLLKRRVGQKVDPLTNEVFIKSSYDPEPSTGQEQDKEETNEEEDDDQEEDKDDEAMDTPDDEFSEDLVGILFQVWLERNLNSYTFVVALVNYFKH